MSEVSNLIFHKKEHWLSSPFGYRKPLDTAAGQTGSFHCGADYATDRKKLAQYAIGNGTVLSCGVDRAYGNAKYVWVSYPALGVKMLHYHLSRIRVKAGQTVDKNTVLGNTGKTGFATGIHLHLGIKSLSGGDWLDPEKWSSEKFLPKKAEAPKKYLPGDYKVVDAAVLNVRRGAGLEFSKVTFDEMTSDARRKIKKLSGKKVDGYVRGVLFTALETKGDWGRTPSGWVNLSFCERV